MLLTRLVLPVYISGRISRTAPRSPQTGRVGIVDDRLKEIQQYRCPGQRGPISRSVHLARLAATEPICRTCMHRHDRMGLSPRTKRRWQQLDRRGEGKNLFEVEGLQGLLHNELGPRETQRVAKAFGRVLRGQRGFEEEPPVVALGSDGRAESLELVAAAAEGLRWAGCHLVDVGPASAACVAMATGYWQIDGALLIGNPAGTRASVGMKFWGRAGRPLSKGAGLEAIEEYFQTSNDRPTRRAGAARRLPAVEVYTRQLAHWFNGLRPLRIVLRTDCGPVADFVASLLRESACRVFPVAQSKLRDLHQAILSEKAHLGFVIGDDGEVGAAWDETAAPIEPARLLAFLARSHSGAGSAAGAEQHRLLEQTVRAEAWHTLNRSPFELATDRQGRFWHRLAGLPVADGLATFARLLQALSTSDRPFSEAVAAGSKPA